MGMTDLPVCWTRLNQDALHNSRMDLSGFFIVCFTHSEKEMYAQNPLHQNVETKNAEMKNVEKNMVESKNVDTKKVEIKNVES